MYVCVGSPKPMGFEVCSATVGSWIGGAENEGDFVRTVILNLENETRVESSVQALNIHGITALINNVRTITKTSKQTGEKGEK